MSDISINRDIVDLGLVVGLTVPDTWLEYQVPHTIVAFAGDLGQTPESLRPSIQVSVDAADSAEDAFRIIREGVRVLPESAIAVEHEDARFGNEVLTLVFAYRNSETRAVQVEVIVAVYVKDPGLVVRATGSCGGSAPADVVERLSGLVASLNVSESVGIGGD